MKTVATHKRPSRELSRQTTRGTLRTRVDVLGFCAEVRRVAAASGIDALRAGELSLVVAELGTNAVLHARGGTLEVQVSASGWSVTASDEGPGFSSAVLSDAGKSDRLGAHGVREPADGHRSFGSGLAAVRRLSSTLSLSNDGPGARVVAERSFFNGNNRGAAS
ncbi:MAG: ATP-binding protein [Archangium sp.]